jgi:tail tube protein
MPVGLNASGIVGIARETTLGIYAAPTKFIPIRSETLEANNELIERRVIRNLAGVVGIVPGNLHYAGDMEIEALDDVVPYFLNASRTLGTKSGSAGNFTYAFTPTHGALPARSLSITVVRNGVVFGYTACIVGSIEWTLDNGMLIARMGIIGAAEATQSLPTPTWPTTAPYGPGQYTIQIPTGTTVCDVDMSYSFSVEDNATPEFRLCGTREAEFARFGERSCSLTLARDFVDKTDFNDFKATPPVSQSINLRAQTSATRGITINTATTIKTAYSVGLAAQGDLTRAEIEYNVVGDPEYSITVHTAEDITAPTFP